MSNFDLKEVSIEKIEVKGNVSEVALGGKTVLVYSVEGREVKYCILETGDKENALRILELVLKREFAKRENEIRDIFGNPV